MDEGLVAQLLEINKQLTEQIVELSRELAQTKAPVWAPTAPIKTRSFPLHVSENEEDAQYLLSTGQISKDEYEDVLKEIGFMNAEITVPVGL
jgi:hypothetical protein